MSCHFFFTKHLNLIKLSLIPTLRWKRSFFVGFDNLILRSRVFDFIIRHKYRTLSDLVATDFFEHIWHVSWQCYIAKEKRRIIMMDGEGRTKGSFYFFSFFSYCRCTRAKAQDISCFSSCNRTTLQMNWPSTDISTNHRCRNVLWLVEREGEVQEIPSYPQRILSIESKGQK